MDRCTVLPLSDLYRDSSRRHSCNLVTSALLLYASGGGYEDRVRSLVHYPDLILTASRCSPIAGPKRKGIQVERAASPWEGPFQGAIKAWKKT